MGDSAIPVLGPFLGVTCLPWREERGRRSPLAVNVDSRRGTIRPRDGYRIFAGPGAGFTCCGLHGWTAKDGTRLVGVLWWNSTVWETHLTVYKADGSIYTTVNLSNYGLPPDHNPWWSAVDVDGDLYFTTPQAVAFRYRYPSLEPGVAPITNSSHQDSFAYLQSFPHGRILAFHEDAMVVADMDEHAWMWCSSTPDEDSPYFDPSMWGAYRFNRRYAQNTLVFSDTFVSQGRAAFCAEQDVGLRAGRGRLTAVLSTDRGLFAFTERDVFRIAWSVGAMTGASVQAAAVAEPVARGAGAVNHRCVAQGRGTVVWLAHDGVYALDTANGVRRISDDIQALWHIRGWSTRPNPKVATSLEAVGYPWRIARSHLDRAHVAWNPRDQTFWVSLPMSGETDSPALCSLVAVWSPATQEWDLYAPKVAGSAERTIMAPTATCSFYDGGRERFLFGTGYGFVCEWGTSPFDVTASEDETLVYAVWQSPRLSLDDPMIVFTADRVRLIQTATSSSGVAQFVNVEGERSFDLADAHGIAAAAGMTQRPAVDELAPDGSLDYIWGAPGEWGTFQWHQRDVWHTFLPLNETLGGAWVTVGFNLACQVDDYPEVFGFVVECTTRRLV